MPVVKLNANSETTAELWQEAENLPPGAPIIVLIHGYRYSPSHPGKDPHRYILSAEPGRDADPACSWPCALGFGKNRPDEGLAVTFGWEACGRLGQAYCRAGQAGCFLGEIILELARRSRRSVALIGHSLGARVALQAMRHTGPGDIGRVILLTGAEFNDIAAEAMDSPAGRCAEVINITSRENDLFDFAVEMLLGRGRRQALGFGLREARRNWIDVQIDHDDTLTELTRLGFPVERTAFRFSHSTPYIRRGLFDFYSTALRQPWALPISMLHARLPGRIEPRWSRLLASPIYRTGLQA